jgi:hypothetical protein
MLDEIRAYLLETEDVGIHRFPGNRDDPRQIGHAVAALAALNVPGEKAHQRMPARMKD